jgi:penicillin-binding protein 2
MDKASSRLKVLALLVVLMFVALSTRLWFLQVLATTTFQHEARENSVRFAYSEPLRGLIYDDRGHVLVQNRESLEVRVNRDAMGKDAEAVVLRLSKLLKVPAHVLVQRLQTNEYYSYQPIPVAEFVSPRVRDYIGEYRDLFPGVEVVPTSVREYPFGRTASHVLGYVSLINSDEYDKLNNKGYEPTDVIGRTGLEQVYEHYLRGTQGVQKFIVNSDGETLRALGVVKEPTAGDDLHLTLDLGIQRAAQRQLVDGLARIRSEVASDGSGYLKANAGTVIVMDAQTGAIRAMTSSPSYDPRWLVRGLTKAQREYLYKNPAAPAINRAVQLPYVPGSTFKPITGLAALKEGFASLGGYYPCDAEYTHPNDTSGTVFHNWTTANLGSMSLAEAIRISCDTVFDKFGSDFYFQYVENQLNESGLLLQNDLHQFGFGEPTGVDLPSEATGLVPDPTWAAQAKMEDGTKLFPDGFVPGIDILTMIGSSYVNATPLQLAQAYGAIANGGHLCRPHLVDQIVAPDGSTVKQPEDKCGRTIPYSPGELSYIRAALGSVVTSGTAQCSFAGFPTSQVWVGGKTGTAERPPYQDTSWFVGMAGKDANSPRYIVLAMVEQGGFGASGAAPIVRHVIEDIYHLPQGGSGCGQVRSDF